MPSRIVSVEMEPLTLNPFQQAAPRLSVHVHLENRVYILMDAPKPLPRASDSIF